MTNSRRAKKARRTPRSSPRPGPIARVRGAADVVAMIPYLLGFQPHDSLVVIALQGPRKRFGPVLRVDLVDDPDLVPQQAAVILEVVTGHRLGPVLVAVFSDDARRAEPLTSLVLAELAGSGVAVEDAFRADGRRWWSYLCSNPSCCSPAGSPYDVRTSAAAAEAVLAGLAFEPDREALRERFAPSDEIRRHSVAQEVQLLRDLPATRAPGDTEGLRMGELVGSRLADPAAAEPSELARLALLVQSHSGRDVAMGLIDRANAARHFELWRHVLVCVSDDLLPPVGCVVAFAAWLDGRGVLASHAVERVLALEPDDSFARLLAELLVAAVDPRHWDLVAPGATALGDPPPRAG